MHMMLQISYIVMAAGADPSCIYLESFFFSFLCTLELVHIVVPNIHIVTGYEPGGHYSLITVSIKTLNHSLQKNLAMSILNLLSP